MLKKACYKKQELKEIKGEKDLNDLAYMGNIIFNILCDF